MKSATHGFRLVWVLLASMGTTNAMAQRKVNITVHVQVDTEPVSNPIAKMDLGVIPESTTPGLIVFSYALIFFMYHNMYISGFLKFNFMKMGFIIQTDDFHQS